MGRVFLNEGDAVLVKAPTYYGALNAFAAYRPGSWVSPWTTRAWTPRRREALEWARKIGTRVKARRFDPGAIMAG